MLYCRHVQPADTDQSVDSDSAADHRTLPSHTENNIQLTGCLLHIYDIDRVGYCEKLFFLVNNKKYLKPLATNLEMEYFIYVNKIILTGKFGTFTDIVFNTFRGLSSK